MVAVLASVITSLIIAFQDFKERKVNVFLFPAVFISGIFIDNSHSIYQLVWRIGLNLLFLIVSLALVAIYFILKYSDYRKVKQQLGAGDILFLVCISPFFNLNHYIVFLSGSFLICLIIFLPFCIQNKTYPIPLAGFQALLFIPTIFLWINGFKIIQSFNNLIF
ncbi:prepilin peptidase [Hyphobacterium sp. CCMP332]|nr:prepilin peptidase [Hyphobacterium sp. CCMP332]